jgi:hypothetical protein
VPIHPASPEEFKQCRQQLDQYESILLSHSRLTPNNLSQDSLQQIYEYEHNRLYTWLGNINQTELESLAYFANRGWDISHCYYSPYSSQPQELFVSLEQSESLLMEPDNSEWLNLAQDFINASGLTINLMDANHAHTTKILLTHSGKKLIQELCQMAHQIEPNDPSRFLSNALLLQGEPPHLIPNVDALAQRLTGTAFEPYGSFIKKLPTVYKEDCAIALFLVSEAGSIMSALENAHIPANLYEAYGTLVKSLPKSAVPTDILAEKGHEHAVFFLSEFVPDELQPLAKAFQTAKNSVIKRSFTSMLTSESSEWLTMVEDGHLSMNFYVALARKDRLQAFRFDNNTDNLDHLPEHCRTFLDSVTSFRSAQSIYLANHADAFIGHEPICADRIKLLGRLSSAYSQLSPSSRISFSASLLPQILEKVVSQNEMSHDSTTIDDLIFVIEQSYASESKELQQVIGAILPSLLETSDPRESFNRIAKLYEKANLPSVFREFLIFKTIHAQMNRAGVSKFQDELLKQNETLRLSPLLTEQTDQERLETFWNYQVRNAIKSADPNLRRYLVSFQQYPQHLQRAEAHSLEELPQSEIIPIQRFCNQAYALLDSKFIELHYDAASPDRPLAEKLDQLRQVFQVEQLSEIPQAIERAVFHKMGYVSGQEVLEAMDTAKKQARERNAQLRRRIYEGHSPFDEGDLLKSTQSGIAHHHTQTGIKCAEATGVGTDRSTVTPYDADCSRIYAADIAAGFDAVLANSITSTSSTENNDLLMLIKDQGQLVDTTQGVPSNFPGDYSRLEVFHSIYGDVHYGKPGDSAKRHYGVTVGLPSSDITAYIPRDSFMASPTVKARLAALAFEVAQSELDTLILYQGKELVTKEMIDAAAVNYAQLQELLAVQTTSGQQIIDCLKQSSALATLFESSAHVYQGYSVEAHTRMVLDLFANYVDHRFMGIHLNSNDFKLLLALHDIGKSISKDTSQQHQFTRPIIESIMEKMNFPQTKKDLIVEIACQDYFGELIQGRMLAKEAANNIEHIARITHVPVDEVFYLCQLYHLCDVSSYTSHADAAVKDGRFDQDISFDPDNKTITLNKDWSEKIELVGQLLNR